MSPKKQINQLSTKLAHWPINLISEISVFLSISDGQFPKSQNTLNMWSAEEEEEEEKKYTVLHPNDIW